LILNKEFVGIIVTLVGAFQTYTFGCIAHAIQYSCIERAGWAKALAWCSR